MDLDLIGHKVIAYDFGYSVGLEFSNGYEVRIETVFLLRTEGIDHEIAPGTEADEPLVAKLTGRVVTLAGADGGGTLRIDFQGGARLLVTADADYEAWTVAGPGGLKVVSVPGGKVSVWSPAS